MSSLDYSTNNTIESLSSVFKTLASGESVTITNIPDGAAATLTLNLTLSGFVKISESGGNQITASKPNYNLGSAVTLDDKNTIDGASLLRSEDLAKPDEKDLKADCGTGKDKKRELARIALVD
ncbi:Oidioi.mRNA.OKI2018_I69.chr2.g5932.t1.cds [Oikopleura dioica]|uniref:Oidioi.mRNA.OKI2018_I69.chr2.g5932.t1.cds n=1 Tax=Oikopleura dioica TaxID=34765 RepID=A0ABN7T2E6_OIKDI|nr:Oidioi.mRNA.OKI2018_I69.chr2.g5932.t1.cds [Oikopleura dioica]